MKILIVLIFSIPFLMGNKGCEKVSTFEHPEIPAGTECAACHDDGRTRETKPAWHDLAWSRNHGQYIRKFGFKADNKSTCTLCHAESQCTSCHQQEKPRNHNEFWRLKGHGLAVGLDRSRCFACHRGADFCERCHAQTQPLDHTALWGAPGNRHCLNCHLPITSAGAQRCSSCHTGTPSHASAPAQPANALHTPGANCLNCHSPLRHPDNGTSCAVCHPR